MMKVTVCNAFSLNMLEELNNVALKFVRLEEGDYAAQGILNDIEKAGGTIESSVGHKDTAVIFSSLLKREIPFNRTNVVFSKSDLLLIGQYIGPRLEEGAISLPEGSLIKWFLVYEA